MVTIDQENVIARQIEDKTILLRLGSGDFCELNAVGTVIWNDLCENKSKEDILSHLEEEFDASRDQIEQDYDQFLAHLDAYQLLIRDKESLAQQSCVS